LRTPRQRILLDIVRDFGEIQNESYLEAICQLTRALAGPRLLQRPTLQIVRKPHQERYKKHIAYQESGDDFGRQRHLSCSPIAQIVSRPRLGNLTGPNDRAIFGTRQKKPLSINILYMRGV